MPDRRQESYAIRLEAAELARSRVHPPHKANGDEQKYAGDRYFMSFTKGLPHNPHTGLLHDPQDFVEFRRAINDGFIDPFSDRVRHGAKNEVKLDNQKNEYVIDPKDNTDFRQWEAPTAGVVYELEGPDAQAVTMDPAPPLLTPSGQVNPELVLEMAEVYELAILRDKPFNDFESRTSNNKDEIERAIDRLNELEYIKNIQEQTGRPRKVGSNNKLDRQTVFRGSSPGVEIGPYLSQFMLIGNPDLNGNGGVDDGRITYGVLEIDQKVPIALKNVNFMTSMDKYVEVQRGISQAREQYESKGAGRTKRRFITTPRDLATYVHYDALYEAYLNACIILLGMQTPFDPAFDHLSGVGVASSTKNRRHAGGFALYGGPHILNLVTEVATRALKAVRFQKFNTHIRLRPEALAARIELSRRFPTLSQLAKDTFSNCQAIETLDKFRDILEKSGTLGALSQVHSGDYFLPMAFPEGSPMHPAYGAGHATVAGACVTILKAFFDTGTVLVKSNGQIRFKRFESGDQAVIFRAPDLDPNTHEPKQNKLNLDPNPQQFLTLEGELNKLAANISIGRNMAGVHFFTDYYDSLRMGEQIAIGILEEQALTYSTDPFVLSLPTFDGQVIRIGAR